MTSKKLAAKEVILSLAKNMQKIDHDHGRFVTIVPHTRAETKEFALKCHLGEIRWEYLTKRPTNRRKGEFDRFNIACGFYQLDEGYTLYWYKSSEKKKRDEASRTEGWQRRWSLNPAWGK